MGLKDLFRVPLGAKIAAVFTSRTRREEILQEMEEQLILADISVDVAQRIIKNLSRRMPAATGKEECLLWLKEDFSAILSRVPAASPLAAGKGVLLLVGVNGSGKTTSAAKLASFHRQRGRKVLLCAADTFRAAGSRQLSLWGEKLGIPVVEGDRGSDSGAVVYRGLQLLTSRDFDLLIVDTAGRVQSKENLMRELEKSVKIIRKTLPGQPAETLLVLDAHTGQNALVQAEKFREFTGITGLFLAKMDGTAKGGTVISIADRLGIPVRYLGVGEAENDLNEFSPPAFVDALIGP